MFEVEKETLDLINELRISTEDLLQDVNFLYKCYSNEEFQQDNMKLFMERMSGGKDNIVQDIVDRKDEIIRFINKLKRLL